MTNIAIRIQNIKQLKVKYDKGQIERRRSLGDLNGSTPVEL